ncbi:MAG: c-type cytochrome [Chitinophagaceae bacterium]
MKKFLVGFSLVIFVCACGGGASADKAAEDSKVAAPEPKKVDVTENPDYLKGLELISKSDCLVCHKIDEKMTGPAYRDVANKYENTQANIDMLAAKVIAGGSGVWGPAMMTPHPGVSSDDAKAMVKYVLLLRNK